MANRVIVAVFATQNHAYDAARHIQNLDNDGIIQLKRGGIAYATGATPGQEREKVVTKSRPAT